jgi:hypothetical protein
MFQGHEGILASPSQNASLASDTDTQSGVVTPQVPGQSSEGGGGDGSARLAIGT